ncbi:MAG: transcription antitermination factor NusB [Patescibacteria group bacterium]
MASRHLARSIAMQSLFEWDFYHGHGVERDATGDFPALQKIAERNKEEFGPGLDEEYGFIDRLLAGIYQHQEQIDKILASAAPEWPIEQITGVDRAVLRLGLFELLFGDRTEVPPKVAINEAIELGKSFGGESSGRFVNGVLGTVYREIGEPGKEYPARKDAEEMDGAGGLTEKDTASSGEK